MVEGSNGHLEEHPRHRQHKLPISRFVSETETCSFLGSLCRDEIYKTEGLDSSVSHEKMVRIRHFDS
jgi:hypothetical protein